MNPKERALLKSFVQAVTSALHNLHSVAYDEITRERVGHVAECRDALVAEMDAEAQRE